MAWAFFQANLQEIKTMTGKASPSLMHAVISFSASGFVTEAKAVEIEQFFAAHPMPHASRKIEQLLESMRINVQVGGRAGGRAGGAGGRVGGGCCYCDAH